MEYETVELKLPKQLQERIGFLAAQCDLTPEQFASAIFILSQQNALSPPPDKE